MTAVRIVVRRSTFHDSVTLMQLQRALAALPGVEDAGAVMGTPVNRDLLQQAGLLAAGQEESTAGPDDLIITVRAADAGVAEAALEKVDVILKSLRSRSGGQETYRPRSLRAALRQMPDANLALVSVPGRHAAAVARQALDEGLHVMLFSDGVALEDEVRLKQAAAAADLLVMGPDCGTALVGGAALGFANGVRRGPVGVVAAAGTGAQEVTTLLHRWGTGVSHAIGTGGRDLSAQVGAASMLAGLRALAADPDTRIIVLVSKPPDPPVARQVLAAAATCGVPVVACFVGASAIEAAGPGVVVESTLAGAAAAAARLAGFAAGPGPDENGSLPPVERLAQGLAPGQCWLRGLYSGGTLAYEAQTLLRDRGIRVHSNVPLDPDLKIEAGSPPVEHTILDLGDDDFTAGRLHPMLDSDLRLRLLDAAATDPEVAVILLDVVLGHGAHPDPAAELAPAVQRALSRARSQGRDLVILCPVTGTDDDPQDRSGQVTRLQDAGAWVPPSHTDAARLAAMVLAAASGDRAGGAPVTDTAGDGSLPPAAVPAPAGAGEVTREGPGVSSALRQLLAGPRVINLGLESFAEALSAQGIPHLHVDWQPPGGGDPRLQHLLQRLEGKGAGDSGAPAP